MEDALSTGTTRSGPPAEVTYAARAPFPAQGEAAPRTIDVLARLSIREGRDGAAGWLEPTV
jgi:hypothetical protein